MVIDREMGDFTAESRHSAVVDIGEIEFRVWYDDAEFDINIDSAGSKTPGDLTLYRIIGGRHYPVIKVIRERPAGTTRYLNLIRG